jgi:hypothetical protein
MKREVPLIITFVAGLVFVVSYFIPHDPFSRSEQIFNLWFAMAGAFAVWLGALSLLKIQLLNISRKAKDWPISLIIILCFLIMVAVGAYDGFKGLGMTPPGSFRDPGTHFDWMYQYVYTPLSSTMFAILAFFVASASYRAFRARNLQATLLLLAAFFVMIGRVPVGDLLSGFLPEGYRLSDLSNWLMAFPQTAGQRAVMIGIALGTASTALRIMLGIERSHLEG